ncbi:MAG: choice-of-anchor J domain-containing protein, partial [Candidatus Symbiothrix sp.]|nr:choice-of-anchor J domain-containing protein [Candidatus Symbiothrix sp.]
MKNIILLLFALFAFSLTNGQNRHSFEKKERIFGEEFQGRRPAFVNRLPEKPDGKELQKSNDWAIQVKDVKLPAINEKLFFESPVMMQNRQSSLAAGNDILYGYHLPTQSFLSFSIDDPAQPTTLFTFTDGDNTVSAGELVNGDFYLTTCNLFAGGNPANLVRLSTETGEVVSSVPVQQHALDMAYDYSTRTMYGITSSGTGSILFTIHLTTGATVLTAQLPVRFVGIAVHLNGTMYGISIDGDLYTINKSDGALALTGATGISPLVGEDSYFTQSIGFNHHTGKLYWAYILSSLTDSGLYEVNTTTGTATRKGFIGSGMQIIALSAPYYADPNIPSAPAGFTVTTGAGETPSAVLNWVNPVQAKSGNALAELSSVEIERDGVPVHTINNPVIGNSETWTDLSIVQNRDYVYSVYGVTNGYPGSKAVKSFFAGYDPCEINTFPLTESFEGDGVPDCWSSIYHSNANQPAPSNAAAHSGKQSWRFSSFFNQADDHQAVLISPRLAVTPTPKTLRFFYNTLSYDMEYFRVGYSVAGSDLSGFVWEKTMEPPATMGWTEYFKQFPAETKFIAIEYLTHFKWYVYIDDITIDKLEDDVAVTAITSPKSGG